MSILVSHFDASRLECYLDCRRKYKLRYLDHWSLREKRNIAADYGTSVHAFMDVWHASHDWQPAIAAFKETWRGLGGDSDTDQTRTERHAEWFLKRYTTKYPEERFKVLATEQPFEIGIGPFTLQGRIDKIIQAPGEAPAILDHKTTSQLGYSTMLKYKPNLQMMIYAWAAKLLVDKDLYSVTVDIISTAKNATKPIDECFARRVVTYTDDELAEFPAMFLELAREINEGAARGVWVPNFGHCMSYGECAFRGVCSEPVDMRDRILESTYEKKVWSPVREGEKVLTGRWESA